MAKRVLGDDPFAPQTDKPAEDVAATATKKSVAPADGATGRASKKPPARTSKRPSAATRSVAPPPAGSSSPSSSTRPSRAPSARATGKSVAPERASTASTPAAGAGVEEPASAAPSGHEARANAPASATSDPSSASVVSDSSAASPAAEALISLESPVVPPAPRAPAMAVPVTAFEAPAALDESSAEESTVAADLPPDVARVGSPSLRTSPSAPPPAAKPAPAAPPAGQHAVEAVTDAPAVEVQIRDLESQLDRLLAQVGERGADAATLDRVAERLRAKMDARGRNGSNGHGAEPSSRVGGGPGASSHDGDARATHAAGPDAPSAALAPAGDDGSVYDVARELLSSEYAARQWGRVALRDRAAEVDEFGLDPKYAARVRPFFDFLYARWWRVEAHDIENVPADGRVILCANHSGALPYDGAMLATALRREHPAHRELRWLAEDFVFHFPFLGVFMNRIGAVRACQENAERLLKSQRCVGVFPEGVKGIAKMFRDRYKLQRFGRGGHVKLAIRTRTPIVPVAILGAEEASPLIAPTQLLAKALGVPYVPITPTFPWLGPAGLVPLPSKWRIFFLEPISVEQYAPDQADDDVLVGRLNEKIRAMIQDQLDRAVRARRSVFRG